MTRREQKARQRELQHLCGFEYTGTHRTFPRAHCKLPDDHRGPHKTWRASQKQVDDRGETQIYLEWWDADNAITY